MALQVGDGGEVLGARETLRPSGLDDMVEREMIFIFRSGIERYVAQCAGGVVQSVSVMDRDGGVVFEYCGVSAVVKLWALRGFTLWGAGYRGNNFRGAFSAGMIHHVLGDRFALSCMWIRFRNRRSRFVIFAEVLTQRIPFRKVFTAPQARVARAGPMRTAATLVLSRKWIGQAGHLNAACVFRRMCSSTVAALLKALPHVRHELAMAGREWGEKQSDSQHVVAGSV